jgi:hypothetical protein
MRGRRVVKLNDERREYSGVVTHGAKNKGAHGNLSTALVCYATEAYANQLESNIICPDYSTLLLYNWAAYCSVQDTENM